MRAGTRHERWWLCVVAVVAGVVFAGCADATGSASNETCAKTLVGSQTICGDDLVRFCRQRYDPDVNADTCDQVLKDAGIDPRSLVAQPPEPTYLGDPVTIQGERGRPELRVTATRVIDDVRGGEFDSPQP